ncbi:GNAT family N-acetyltransferase [Streptomyces sp. NPDC005195]|uniref:GNAT family N-acetyltransferase n=1 Tax=Streptomyces sp. NPDC005195 TaxID=3154561 RepID=UPI0033B68E8B
MTLCLREYRGPDAMELLTRQWRELYAQDRLATPFQSSGWLIAWARQLPCTATPLVLAVISPTGRTLAALALARHEDGPRPRIVPLSWPHAWSVHPVGPHADDPDVAHALAFHLLLVAEHDQTDVDMRAVPADSTLGRSLSTVAGDISWTRTIPTSTVVPLPALSDLLPPSIQREHARRRRTWTRLSADRTITYTRTRHLQDLLTAVELWAELQHDQSPPQDGADDTAWGAVLEDLGAANASIAALSVDDTTVAAQMCLTRGHHCYTLPLATHPAARHLAPGHALLRHLVDDLTDDGIRTLHLDPTTGRTHASRGQYGPPRPAGRAAVFSPVSPAAA